jgi:hypothetical protein
VVLVSNLDRDNGYPDYGFRGIPKSLHKIPFWCLNYDKLNPSEPLSIHHPLNIFHRTLLALDIENVIQ